ncbi:MAG: GAF domain-containing protein, partial [Candidatus Rokubacteria bacterium]|nr:GAF domain-containing protein [Candidatus Rokubacteria bacterium]
MKIGKVFPDLLTPLGSADSVEAGLGRTLRALVDATGAGAGRLVFRPARGAPVTVVGRRRRLPAALATWLRTGIAAPPRRPTLTDVVPPVIGKQAWLRVPLGDPRRSVGELALLGRRGRLTRATLPSAFPRELGIAVDRVWELHGRAVRMAALNEISRVAASTESRDALFAAFGDTVARLVAFDGIGVSLVDPERGDFEVADLPARSMPQAPRQDARFPLGDTLLARVVADATPLRIDDVAAADVPPRSRAVFGARGYRSAALIPLMSRGAVLGAVTLAGRGFRAFSDGDVEVVAELARPLASGL